MFDEMASWYNDVKDGIGADVKESVDASSSKQDSKTLSGLGESSSSASVDTPWSGKLRTQNVPQVSHKGKEKVGEAPCMTSVSSCLSYVNVEFNGLE